MDIGLAGGIIVVRIRGRPSGQDLDAYLARYTELLERRVPYSTVFSAERGTRMPEPSHVRRQIAWMKGNGDLIASHCQGLAFVFRSPLMRGVLKGVLSMQPLGAKHIVLRDEPEAISWAHARLLSVDAD